MAFSINPLKGGVERVYTSLVSVFRRNGAKVFAAYFDESPEECDNIFDGTCRLNGSYYNIPGYSRQLNDYICANGINLLIIPYLSPGIPQALPVGIDKIYHIHNKPTAYYSGLSPKLPRWFNNSIAGKFVARLNRKRKFKPMFAAVDADPDARVLLLSNSFKKDLEKLYTFNPEKVSAIANPIEVTDNINNPIREKVILYVGRLDYQQKRPDRLLKIWGKLQNKLPDWSVKILGDGPMKEKLQQTALKENLQRIEFLGFQKPDNFYRTASLCCMTSNFEGFPMTIIEAMSNGCIPMAFNSFESLSEIIDDGQTGYIINPFDLNEYCNRIIEFAALSPTEQGQMRKAAQAKAAHFSTETIERHWRNYLSKFQ